MDFALKLWKYQDDILFKSIELKEFFFLILNDNSTL